MIRALSLPLLAGAALAALCAPATAQEQAAAGPVPFLQVSGSAQVRVPSDRAHVSVAVVTEAATAADAAAENARLMEAVIAALRATNATGLRIETWGYALHPRYSHTPRDEPEPRIIGYQAVNNVRTTVDDVDAVGRLIDAAIAAGANRVTSLEFEARDTEAARQQALREAVAKARVEAQTMADALGVPLGPPLEVHGGAQPPQPRPFPMMEARMAMDVAQAAPTPIEATEQTVFAQVTIKYRLGSDGR